MRREKNIFVIPHLIIALTLLLAPVFTHAASPLQLILTWQASNSYPSNYPLKAAATGNTPVTVSVAGLRDGKFVDLSQTNIAWWRDSSYLMNGVGMTSITFNVEWRYKRPGTSYSVRAIVLYDGAQIDATVDIPVVSPRLALTTPYFGNVVVRGNAVAVTAVPYFFSAGGLDNLTFKWTINGVGQPAQAGQNVAHVTIADDVTLSGSYVPVSVQATNMEKLEQAEGRINLTIR